MLRTFVNNDKYFVIEVISLHESGFKLVELQKDLTVVQKIFLKFAYPIFNEHMNKLQENNNTKSINGNVTSKTVTDPSFEERYKQRIKEKQNKL